MTPCNDYPGNGIAMEAGGSSVGEALDHETETWNILTRLACDRCKEIEARGGKVPDFARQWWRDHKKKDAEKLRRDQDARNSTVIRKQAIAKLTRKEREELGV